MTILPNTDFYIKLLPSLIASISDIKIEVKKKRNEYTIWEHGTQPRVLTQIEVEKLVSLTNFLTELESLETTIGKFKKKENFV